MYITDTEVTFIFCKVLKNSRPSYKQKPLIFKTFISRTFCPVTTIITYLEHILLVFNDPTLFITTVKPHKKISKGSISRWKKLTMPEVEILILDFNFP